MYAACLANKKNVPLAALKHFENTVRAGGKSHRLFYFYGKALFTKGENQKAVKMLKKAVEIDPLDARLYMYMGLAYHEMGGHEETGKRYRRLAMEIDPGNAVLRELAARVKRG